MAAARIVILVDELLQKDYGLSFEISLFIATITSASPLFGMHFPYHRQHRLWTRVRRCLVALFHLLFAWDDEGHTLRDAFWRDCLPNFMNLLAIVTLFAAVIYL